MFLGDQNQVIAYHEFDSNGALIWSKNSQSSRGVVLKNLMNRYNNKKSENENLIDINIQYNFIKPYSLAKLIGISSRGNSYYIKKIN